MTLQEINEAVARKLTRPELCRHGNDGICVYCLPKVAAYSTSIEAAWEIMEYLAPKFFGISIGHGTNPDFWQCEIHGKGFEKIYERADTGPLAICQAFLKLP